MDNIKPIQINKSDFIFDEENNEIIFLMFKYIIKKYKY